MKKKYFFFKAESKRRNRLLMSSLNRSKNLTSHIRIQGQNLTHTEKKWQKKIRPETN